MKNEISLLEEFGLGSKEAKTYMALLELGETTIKPIADRAGLKRTTIYNFMETLIEIGIVGCVKKRGRTYYYPEHPLRLLELQKKRLERLEQGIPGLTRLFSLSPTKPRISYFEGAKQMQNIFLEEPRCKKEALYIFPGLDILSVIGVRFMAGVDRERIKKGVRIRSIRFRHKDVPYSNSAHGAKYLRDLRFAPPGLDFSMGMGIYDNGKVGFFSSGKESFGILIESEELVQLLRGLYELFWIRSTPARPGEG